MQLKRVIVITCEGKHSAFCNYQNSNQISMSLIEMLDILCYHVIIGAVREHCLTNHGEDHCHED